MGLLILSQIGVRFCPGGGVRLSRCLEFISPLAANQLSLSLAGGVLPSPCLHFNCLIYTLVANDLSPVRLSGCLQSCSNSFVSQSGWWCRALRTFPIHLFSLLASHLSPIPGLPRRAILSVSELKEVSNITVHLGRFVPGFFHTWRAKRVFGQRPAVVYWAQMAPAKQHCCAQPLLGWLRSFIDMVGHQADLTDHEGTTYIGATGTEAVEQTIKHAPHMILAEFGDPDLAVRAARICKEAGVAGSVGAAWNFSWKHSSIPTAARQWKMRGSSDAGTFHFVAWCRCPSFPQDGNFPRFACCGVRLSRCLQLICLFL